MPVLTSVRPSVSQSALLNGAAMSALAMSDGALQARPLAGVTAQGTEALEAALPRSSWVLLRVTSANTAAMAPLGVAWPGAAAGASGDSLTGDRFTGAEFPYSYRQRGKPLLSEKSANKLLPAQSNTSFLLLSGSYPPVSPAASPQQQQ